MVVCLHLHKRATGRLRTQSVFSTRLAEGLELGGKPVCKGLHVHIPERRGASRILWYGCC